MKPVSQARGWLVLLLVACCLIWPKSSFAHAGGVPVLTDTPAGPYHVFAWMLPEPQRVGVVHLSLAVIRAPEPGAPSNVLVEPVTDADVQVTFTPLTAPSQAIVVAALPQTTLNEFYYEVDVELPQATRWQIAIEIEGVAGFGTVIFERDVLEARQINWLLVGGGGAGLLLIIGLVGIWNRLQTKE